jgi:hypothetical protein
LRKHVWITNFPFLEQLYPFKSSFQRIWSCIFLTFTTSDMGWKPRQCQLQTLDWFRLYFNSLFGLENRKTGFYAIIEYVSPFQKGKEHMKPSFIFPVITRKPISILAWLEQTN